MLLYMLSIQLSELLKLKTCFTTQLELWTARGADQQVYQELLLQQYS